MFLQRFGNLFDRPMAGYVPEECHETEMLDGASLRLVSQW
jgi:hypothetical protein